MKRFLSAIVGLSMLLTLASCGGGGGSGSQAGEGSGETGRLILGTSSTGSTYYILGTGWSDIMKDAVPGVEISVEATPGGITNMQAMRSGDMDLGMTTCWLAGDAKDGTGWADGTKYDNCLSLFPTHSSVMYIFTLANSGIESIMDIQGKRVGAGALGSTSGDAAPLIFEALGIEPKSITGLSSTGICDALKDGTIDVGIGVTGVPASWMLDLETTQDVKIIPLSDEEINTILEAQPYWTSGVIPGGVYKGHDEDIPCITFWNMIVGNDSLSEDLVYNLCKATYETVDELAQVDQNATGISYDNLYTMTVPLHPGALRYYTEQGVEIPDSLIAE